MTKTWNFFLGFAALLTIASCGGDPRGSTCHTSDDCDEGRECVPIAFGCVDSGSCDSTCEDACAASTECGSGEACETRNGHKICVETDPEQPGE